jgi:hypothetical protein
MIDYSKYPANWKTEIVPRIKARAGEVLDAAGKIVVEAKCEWCHVPNHETGARDRFGVWREENAIHGMNSGQGMDCYGEFPKMVTIVLTTAHLDHDKENHEVTDDRLAALCQRCHLNYDRTHHLEVQKANRERRKGPTLFDDVSTAKEAHLVQGSQA